MGRNTKEQTEKPISEGDNETGEETGGKSPREARAAKGNLTRITTKLAAGKTRKRRMRRNEVEKQELPEMKRTEEDEVRRCRVDSNPNELSPGFKVNGTPKRKSTRRRMNEGQARPLSEKKSPGGTKGRRRRFA